MPHSINISPDGRVVGYDRSRPQPILPPWQEVTPEQFALAQALPYPRLVNGALVNDPPAPPAPPPRRYSKLGLRRALRAAGLEVAFDAALASSPEALADWQDATELREDDPVLAGAVPALAAAAGVTVEQAWALLAQAEIAP